MSTLKEYKNLWVLIETEDGKVKSVGLELLQPGRKLADTVGQKLVAVVIGQDTKQAAQDAVRYGADEVIVVEGAEYAHFTTDAYTDAMDNLVERYKPAVILIGATPNGRDMAPRLACRRKTGLTADCTELDMDAESGNVLWTRPAFGGNLMACILCPETRPQIGTVRPGVFKKPAPDPARTAPLVREAISVPPQRIRTRLVETICENAAELVKLEDAEIIVAGGRGLGKAENFALLRELAQALGGVVASSRAPVDAGWISHIHQVGQTGKAVGPKLYIACGISGAIQHMAGVAGCDCLVAVNKDPGAPIFEVADYGVVGDLLEVVPALTAEIKRLKAG